MADAWTILGIVIQGILAAVGVWYGLETRQARVHSQRQLRLLETQSQGSIFPFIIPSVNAVAFHEDHLMEIATKKPLTLPSRDEYTGDVSKIRYVVSVRNDSGNVAQQARCVMFDARSRHFIRATRSKAWIRGHYATAFYLGDDVSSKQDILDMIRRRYPEGEASMARALEGETSFCILLYLDIDGNACWSRRDIHEEATGVVTQMDFETSRTSG